MSGAISNMNEILFCIWSLLGSIFLSLETFDLCIKQRLDPEAP
jgi:hypothetical protein